MNGIIIAVSAAGADSVRSSQSMSVSSRIIRQATKSSAGAVAKAGIEPASGEKKRPSRKRTPTTTAVRPVRPPACTPEALST